jgi:hypothetical protein
MEWTDWRRYVGKHLLTSFAVLLMVLAIASVLWYLFDTSSFLDVFHPATIVHDTSLTSDVTDHDTVKPAAASMASFLSIPSYATPAAHRIALSITIPPAPMVQSHETEMSLPVTALRCVISHLGPHQQSPWWGTTLHQSVQAQTPRLDLSSADPSAQWVDMTLSGVENLQLDPITWDLSVQYVEYDVSNHGETYSIRVYVSDPVIPCGTKAIWHGMEADGITRKYWFVDLYHPHHTHLAPMPVLKDVYATCVYPLTVHYQGPMQPRKELITMDHVEQVFHVEHQPVCEWSKVCEQMERGGIHMVLHGTSRVTLSHFDTPSYWHRKHIGLHDSCWLAIMMDVPLWPITSLTVLPDDTWGTSVLDGDATTDECMLHETSVHKAVPAWRDPAAHPYI